MLKSLQFSNSHWYCGFEFSLIVTPGHKHSLDGDYGKSNFSPQSELKNENNEYPTKWKQQHLTKTLQIILKFLTGFQNPFSVVVRRHGGSWWQRCAFASDIWMGRWSRSSSIYLSQGSGGQKTTDKWVYSPKWIGRIKAAPTFWSLYSHYRKVWDPLK